MSSDDLFRVGNILKYIDIDNGIEFQVLVTGDMGRGTGFSGIVISDNTRIKPLYRVGHFSSRWSTNTEIWELVNYNSNISVTVNRRNELANELELYNRWRRGDETLEQPDPTELGVLIDEIVKELRR